MIQKTDVSVMCYHIFFVNFFFKTMSRSGQRKCRSASSNTDQSSALKKSGETGSECGSEQQKEATSESEVITLDIFDDSVWDTDLEAEG